MPGYKSHAWAKSFVPGWPDSYNHFKWQYSKTILMPLMSKRP